MSTIFSSSDSKNEENATFSKDRPFFGKIKSRYLLNKKGSSKKTYHVSIDISGSNISYQEGDALAIYPSNPEYLVDFLIKFLNEDKQTQVFFTKKTVEYTTTLHDYLASHANLSRISPALFDLFRQFSTCSVFKAHLELLSSIEEKENRIAYIQSHDVISMAKMAGSLCCSTQEFTACLAPMLPRFYSIASSSSVSKDAIDLLVATFSYEVHGELREGIGSEFLCTKATEKTPIPLYVHSNPNFKLPENSETPIIMIGPGTGLAPFRGFIQKRVADNPLSKNWLFFGERHRVCDFYYEHELTAFEKQNSLKLSCAFSRDQEDKIYVQHKLLEHKQELWQWLLEGACIYVCGDAKQMAKDVTAALLTIFESEGNLSPAEQKDLFSQLKKAKRLQMDVY